MMKKRKIARVFTFLPIFATLAIAICAAQNSVEPPAGAALLLTASGDGSQVYTALTAVTLMVFYVFALQCVSTVAVVRRETNSWKWPAFQWLYMGALAWGLAFITYQGGRLLGWR